MTVQFEELTMNAWPSLRTVALDGWLLRLADGFTKRANAVHAVYNGIEVTDLSCKIASCEDIYCRAGQDTIFKLTPFSPAGLDETLEHRGYVRVDPSRVMMLADLSAVAETMQEGVEIEQQERLTAEWLKTMCGFNGFTSEQQAAADRIMSTIAMKTGYFTLYVDGRPAACGLGVIERGFVGLYDIVTEQSMRSKGYGEQLIIHILQWARRSGASRSYLLVLRANGPANRLYTKLNYRELYPYWYRVKVFSR
ncbi:GNAT family N-acetyltransferase [Paenibacillus sp. R14(2021)]|uniref:GNAT family N-acetyltransferase n=1 Tax=Paenibacillus sp. R14(2021) TaxID=2859228 RepID=UPI001C6165F4|nr:GNAT family N-acetyltransferase [Paenibacillus sp. R14(2021)]